VTWEVAVLRVGKVRRGGHAYYLDVTGDSRRPGIEPPGTWVGRGPGALGLDGVVDRGDLEAVLAGASPRSGQVLGPYHHRVQVAGFDLTFCAPKSVSILHGLADPDVALAVRAGHDAAVEAALDYVEDHAVAVRRIDGDARVPVPAGAVTSAAFVHRTSRALDPHLHTHVVMANLGRADDGTWSALDGRGVYAHAPAAAGLYHAQLRHELTTRLGVTWGPLDRGRADVVGIGVDARREFSQRAAAIAGHLAERGLTGQRASEVAGHVTRPAKDTTLSADDLRPRWRAQAASVGLGPQRLEAVLHRVPARVPGDEQRVLSTDVPVVALAGQGRAVTRRDVVRAWCDVLPEGAPAGAVQDAADRLLGRFEPVSVEGTARDGPGVGERRYVVGPPEIEVPAPGTSRRVDDRIEVARALGRRSMRPQFEREMSRSYDSGMGLG
jgi:conjugative relaxase-like TrwC/TraI family protein